MRKCIKDVEDVWMKLLDSSLIIIDLIPIHVRDIDLYMNWEKLSGNLNWKNEQHSKFIEAYLLSM